MRTLLLARRTLPGVALLLLAVTPAFAQAPLPADPLTRSWKRITTPAYTVVSEGSDDEAREVAARIDLFRAAVTAAFPTARLEAHIPTTLLVFDSTASFAPFKPLSDGRRQQWVGGYAMLSDDSNYLVMPRGLDPVNTYQVVFHEYMHYVMSGTFARVPLWYGEGVAEMFGAFAGSSHDSRPMIGRPISYRLASVRGDGLLPARDMLVERAAARWQTDSTARFYGTAWVMAHYFLMNPERQQPLLALFKALDAGTEVDAAVQAALGHSVQQLDENLQNYIRRPMFPALAVRTGAGGEEQRPAVVPMTESEIAFVHADVLVTLGDLKGANRLLSRATTRAPHHDGLRTVTARLRLAEKKPDEALTVLADATSPRSIDSLRAEADVLISLRRYDAAAERLTAAVALAAPTPSLYFTLGHVQMARRAWPDATTAFARLKAIDPRPSWDLRRAYAAFDVGLDVYVAGASRAYIAKAGWSDTSSPYAAFAGILGLLRDKREDEAKAMATEVVAHTTPDDWPNRIAALLLGTLADDAVVAKARSDRERTEAHAYAGLLAGIRGQRDRALTHLRWVKANGDAIQREHRWALDELERLGGQTPFKPQADNMP